MSISDTETQDCWFRKEFNDICARGFLNPIKRRSYTRCDSTLEKSIACPYLIRRRRIVGSGRNLTTSVQEAFSTPSEEDPIQGGILYHRKVHRMSIPDKEMQDCRFRKEFKNMLAGGFLNPFRSRSYLR
jgi:hypothetical protein